MGRLVNTGLGSSSLVVLSSTIPLPPREQLCTRYCSNKHTHRPVTHTLVRTLDRPVCPAVQKTDGLDLWTLESWIFRLRGHPQDPIAVSQMLEAKIIAEVPFATSTLQAVQCVCLLLQYLL